MVNFDSDQKGKKIFVLGSTGFIGSALTKRLIELGFSNIFCLYRCEEKRKRSFSNVDTSLINFIKGDALDSETIKPGIKDADIVVNATGLTRDWGSKEEFWQSQVDVSKLILKMVQEMNTQTQIIHFSTSALYGYGKRNEASRLRACDELYTASKLDIHLWLREQMTKLNKCSVTILAPTIVWGPGDPIYLPKFVEKLKNKSFIYIGKNEPLNFVHIQDVVDSILCSLFNSRVYNQEYIINGPRPFPLSGLIENIAECLHVSKPKIRVPLSLIYPLAYLNELLAKGINIFWARFTPALTRLQVLSLSVPVIRNIKKAREELGYDPKVDFQQGVEGVKTYINDNKDIGIRSGSC